MTELVVQQAGELDAETVERLRSFGQLANEYVAHTAFSDYQDGITSGTRQMHRHHFRLFSQYLQEAAGAIIGYEAFMYSPAVWQEAEITRGAVVGFVRWMKQEGFAISTINNALATVRKYADLAFQAGFMSETEIALIKTVKTIKRETGENIDENRRAQGQATRRPNTKKAEAIVLSPEQVRLLKTFHRDNELGRRDRLMFCLLFDLALRASEVSDLKTEDIDLHEGVISVYRRKVKKNQMFKLDNCTPELMDALHKYLQKDAKPGPLLRAANHKLTGLTDRKLSAMRISKRVRYLGKKYLGIENLSAHDCRHTTITLTARRPDNPIESIQQFGGWTNITTAGKYVKARKFANAGITLPWGQNGKAVD